MTIQFDLLLLGIPLNDRCVKADTNLEPSGEKQI